MSKPTKAFKVPLPKPRIVDELKRINEGALFKWQLQQNKTDYPDKNRTVVANYLYAQYTLPNFTKTWAFLGDVAKAAHKLRHHPTILTTYNKVEFEITTHDAGNKVTEKDNQLAAAIQEIHRNYQE